MKIFTIEITTVSGHSAQAIFERADLKAALSAHHSVLASALANPNCTEVLSMVINSDGGIYEKEHWRAADEPSKIFTIEITTAGGQTAPAIYGRADLRPAMSAHHTVMASALANPDCTEVLSMVINSDGGVYKSENWRAGADEQG